MIVKPCPFCGSTGRVIKYKEEDKLTVTGECPKSAYTYFVICTDQRCKIRPVSVRYYRKRDAVNAWNIRNGEKRIFGRAAKDDNH